MTQSDIVERLTDRIGVVHSHYISDDIQLLHEAKAEITRLRAERPGWDEEKKELQEAIHELQEDLMKATGGTMPSKRNAVHAMGWAEAIEQAAAMADSYGRGSGNNAVGKRCHQVAKAIRALHPSVAEGRGEEPTDD